MQTTTLVILMAIALVVLAVVVGLPISSFYQVIVIK